ncbi:MAG: hypothetical protein CO108_09710 [Deltaproteobacteria bacterium CG_4_9_14_3_um_filter_63_12]|nr:MAG: hypothetical protein CO108_09710 [Deltaproteobacteria bacterium CG_4_9_14_3_um_filter_63_12]
MNRRIIGCLSFCFIALGALGCDDDPKKKVETDTTTDATIGQDVVAEVVELDGTEADAELTEDLVEGVDLRIPGLSASVKMETDTLGVVHLTCQTDDDCIAAQGYVHAQQRFFTMDLARRQTTGRLSTVIGELGLKSDKYYRQLMSTRDGEPLEEKLWNDSSPSTKQLVLAYTRGVNAWLADMRANRNGAALTREYFFLLIDREVIPDWEPTDTMALALNMFAMLSLDDDLDTLRGEAAATLSAEANWDLFGLSPATSAAILPASGIGTQRPELFDIEGLRDVQKRLAPARTALAMARQWVDSIPGRPSHQQHQLGSNNWALSTSRTSTGHALLANDPHLGLSNPAIWFFMELDSKTNGTGSLHVVGASIPAAPFILLGHNETIAWGETVANYDLTDVYIEQLNDTNDAVIVNGAEIPILTKEHTFQVSKKPSVVETLEWVPAHGPVLSKDLVNHTAVTVRWVAFDGCSDIDAFQELNTAANVDEAIVAFSKIQCVNQNFVVADTSDNIAWAPHIHLPQRPWASSTVAPWLPLPGDGTAEWSGWVADADLPSMLNPPNGFIGTANHAFDNSAMDGDPTNETHPYWQNGAAAGYRGQRLVDLVEAGGNAHTPQTMMDMQHDKYSLWGETIVPPILAAAGSQTLTANGQKIADALQAWDYECPTGLIGVDPKTATLDPDPAVAASSIGCLAFHALTFALKDAAYDDELQAVGLSSDNLSGTQTMVVLTHALATPQVLLTGDTLWDDVDTAGTVETKDELIAAAMDVAGTQLAELPCLPDGPSPCTPLLGADTNEWRWGRVHTVSLASIFQNFGLAAYNNGPFISGGGAGTLDVAHPGRDFTFGHGPSLRMVNEFTGTGINSWFQLPGGQNLAYDSPHWGDLMLLWLSRTPSKLLFDRAEVTAGAESTDTFNPAP